MSHPTERYQEIAELRQGSPQGFLFSEMMSYIFISELGVYRHAGGCHAKGHLCGISNCFNCCSDVWYSDKYQNMNIIDNSGSSKSRKCSKTDQR